MHKKGQIAMKDKVMCGIVMAGVLLTVFSGCGKQQESQTGDVQMTELVTETADETVETEVGTETVTEAVTVTETETAVSSVTVAETTTVTKKTTPLVTTAKQPDNVQPEPQQPAETQPEPITPVGDDVTFQISGNVLRVGDDASGFVAAVPPEFEETSPSMYGTGEDISYYYNDFTIYVWNGNGGAAAYSIDITGSGAATQKGITIGSSAEDVIAAYGTEYTEQAMDYVYTYGDCTLRFTLVDGQVHYISYHKDVA